MKKLFALLFVCVILCGCSKSQEVGNSKRGEEHGIEYDLTIPSFETFGTVPATTPAQRETSPDRSYNMMETPDSTCFSEIGYNSYDEILQVTFRDSGKTYRYYDFPKSEWDVFRVQMSLGKYFNAYIKGNYEYKKMN